MKIASASVSAIPCSSAEIEPHCCWICHCDEEDEDEKLLSGLCSCRGSHGHFHMSCMVGIARTKSSGWIESGEFYVQELRDAWLKCDVCKRYWMDDMAINLANECSKFVETVVPVNHELRIIALNVKLDAIDWDRLDTKEGAAFDLIRAVDDGRQHMESISHVLAFSQYWAYMALGCVAELRKDPICAIEYYTNAKEALVASDASSVLNMKEVEVYIANSRSLMPGADKAACATAYLALCKEYYELTKQELGCNSKGALHAGHLLAVALRDSKQFVACERQCTTNHQMALRLYGKDDSVSISLERFLDNVRAVKETTLAAENARHAYRMVSCYYLFTLVIGAVLYLLMFS